MDIQQPIDSGLREIALFAGAGGGILGGKLLGWKTVCAVEINAYAAAVLLARQNEGVLPPFPIWDDVRTFDGRPWRGIVDVVSGGFPCQDISAAGKGAGIEGKRSGMWTEMARIIGEVRPRFAFVENSPMLTSRGLGRVLGDVAEMGYDARWGVMGAFHTGAPHRRERIWILATDSNLCRRDDGSNTERQHETDNAQIRQTQEEQQSGSFGQYRVSANGCDVADTYLPYGEGARFTDRSNTEYTFTYSSGSWWRQDPAKTPKSNVGRVANGVASRVDRLKAIGNGQVPAVVALAWNTLRRGRGV